MSENPDGPAKVTVLHVVEPVQAHLASSDKRYRNHGESRLSIAYHKNQLMGGIIRDSEGRPKYTASERYSAGNEYRRMWEAIQAAACDSTQIGRVSGTRHGIGDAQADALQSFGRLTALLSPVDRLIVHRVCAEDFWPSFAVREACGPSYAKLTIPRLNEALDALIEALIKMKRQNGRNGP
jgi:hypothetical protein